MGRKIGKNKKLYAFVDALVATGTREIVRAGLVTTEAKGTDEAKAREVAHEIAKSICFQYAKSIMYVPVDLELQLSQRDDEIWRQYGQDGPDGTRKFSPGRVAQLAEDHNLTVAHVYAIVKAVHLREIASRQGVLPGLEDDAAET